MTPAGLPEPRLLIGGELRRAAGAAEFPIENPATGEVIGHAPDATGFQEYLEIKSIAVAAARSR